MSVTHSLPRIRRGQKKLDDFLSFVTNGVDVNFSRLFDRFPTMNHENFDDCAAIHAGAGD